MNNFPGTFLAMPFFLLAAGLNAATVIEMQDSKHEVQRFYIGDNMARWDTGAAEGYMLIELNGSKVYNVDPRDRTISIVDTGEFSGQPKKPAESGKLKHMGAGPKIAGYATEKYRLSSAGMHCADVYLSKSAIEVAGVRKMWSVMEEMAERASAMAGGFAPAAKDACEAANTSIMGELASYGMPMRSLGKNGQLESEIVKIEENKETAADFFSLPKGYREHDMNAQMHMLEQMNNQLPSPERMMNMTDEERQKMIIEIMGK